MKKGLLIFMVAVAAGIAAFGLTRMTRQAEHSAVLLDSMPELAWLRGELNLTDEQFARASELHAAYRPQCVDMCRRISEARAKLESLARDSREMSPQLAEAIQNHARVRAECRQKMLEHLYQTAGLMNERQAARYLEVVLPAALESNSGDEPSRPHH